MKTNQLNKDNIINFLRANKKFLNKEFGVTKIALFGSYARGEQQENSDIDVVIDTTDFSFKTHCKLKSFLSEHFNKKVDLVYFDGMRSFIRASIEEELVYA